MEFDYIKIVTTVVLAVLGWTVGHYFNSQRTRTRKEEMFRLTT